MQSASNPVFSATLRRIFCDFCAGIVLNSFTVIWQRWSFHVFRQFRGFWHLFIFNSWETVVKFDVFCQNEYNGIFRPNWHDHVWPFSEIEPDIKFISWFRTVGARGHFVLRRTRRLGQKQRSYSYSQYYRYKMIHTCTSVHTLIIGWQTNAVIKKV